MPRSKKYRKVCCMPDSTLFGALDHGSDNSKIITLSIEEYESIRLIDLEEMTQEECAKHMKVARTTVQRIYIDARKKIAEHFVMGYLLKIEGGSYTICDEDGLQEKCGRGCRKINRAAVLRSDKLGEN